MRKCRADCQIRNLNQKGSSRVEGVVRGGFGSCWGCNLQFDLVKKCSLNRSYSTIELSCVWVFGVYHLVQSTTYIFLLQ